MTLGGDVGVTVLGVLVGGTQKRPESDARERAGEPGCVSCNTAPPRPTSGRSARQAGHVEVCMLTAHGRGSVHRDGTARRAQRQHTGPGASRRVDEDTSTDDHETDRAGPAASSSPPSASSSSPAGSTTTTTADGPLLVTLDEVGDASGVIVGFHPDRAGGLPARRPRLSLSRPAPPFGTASA